MNRPKPGMPSPRVMGDLLSARLHALANLSAATTSLRVERKFGLSLLEWRSLGQLGGYAPLSLKELGQRAGLEKSYASRMASALIDRGLVASERNDADGRGVVLSLTEEGTALYRRAFGDAVARNEKLLAPLRKEQRQQLMEMLGLLTVSARKAFEDERAAAASGVDDEPETAPEDTSCATGSQANFDMTEMRYLVARLGELIDRK
jgi:DNA-binding MarR family transcriptional regulator